MMREASELAVGFVLLLCAAAYGGYAIGKYQGRSYTVLPVVPQVAPAANVDSGDNMPAEAVDLTIASIAQHNTPADCWLIISNKVYNVTNFLNQHPGGAFRITPYCGQDATQAFATKGGEGQHSAVAQQDLAALYIGPVGGTAEINQNNPSPAASAQPRSREDEDEREDD